MNLQDKKVTVMGLGLHGGALGTINWLISQGAHVTATDLKTEEQLASTISKLPDSVRLVLGRHEDKDFTDVDLVVRNPAVPRNSEYLQKARDADVPVEMDSSLFFAHCPSPHIIGITGSKGKTTVTAAIYHLLHAHNADTVVVGIDGVSPLGQLARISPTTTVVFELSSWRLEPLQDARISPPVAVVTSIYREHLNTYDSFTEYVDVKKSVFNNQGGDGIAILNADDATIVQWKSEIPGDALWFSLKTQVEGIFVRDEHICIHIDGKTTKVMPLNTLPTSYTHEQRNLLPAILLAHIAGMQPKAIRNALAAFQRLPHRLELIRDFEGVHYINDSAATMPDATIAALTTTHGPTVLIIGGNDKELDFETLAQVISTHDIRAFVWLPGTATKKMQAAILSQTSATPSTDAKSMEEAVAIARDAAQPGDTVLLSPGATSFGLFAHEFDRGDTFRRAVEALG